MKVFTRYIAGRFVGPFLFGMGVFALLVFLGDLFDKMNKITTSPASAGVILEYLLLQAPYWTVRIIPVATLLAVLFAVSSFVRSGEFVAVQAAGFEAGKFFRPLLWMSVLVAVLTFIAQETFLPMCYARAMHLWHEKVHPEWEWDIFQNRVLPVGPDRLVSFKEFQVKAGTMKRPVLDDYGPKGLTRQLDANGARWDTGKRLWVFEDGVERTFDGLGAVSSERRFERLASDFSTPPKKLRPYKKQPDEMSFVELRRFIERLKGIGRPTHRERTGLHAKLAYPFTNLILCALGIPIALRLRTASRPVAFAAALVVSFFYLFVIEMGGTLGKTGRLPPFAAAWLANVVFGAVALWLLRRAEQT